MSNVTIALIFVLTLNLLMAVAQISALNLSDEYTYVMNEENNLVTYYAQDGVLDTRDSTISEAYPEVAIIEPSSGNPFTDLVSSIKSWFSNKLGFRYVKAIVMGPYNTIRSLNLPEPFPQLIGGFWYALTIFIVIAFFWGKG